MTKQKPRSLLQWIRFSFVFFFTERYFSNYRISRVYGIFHFLFITSTSARTNRLMLYNNQKRAITFYCTDCFSSVFFSFFIAYILIQRRPKDIFHNEIKKKIHSKSYTVYACTLSCSCINSLTAKILKNLKLIIIITIDIC